MGRISGLLFLLSAIQILVGPPAALAHQVGKAATADKKFTISLQPSGQAATKGAHHEPEFFVGDPLAFDIKVLPGKNAGKESPQVIGLAVRARGTTKARASQPRLRRLADGTFFADNITLPIAGVWEFTVSLQRASGAEDIAFSYKVLERSGGGGTAFAGEKLPDFNLTDAGGQKIALENLQGKVWVVNYFFASCPDVCPRMTQKMAQLQNAFKDAADFRLVSITTDPGHDSPAVLQAYGKKYKADFKKWFFLTGDKKAIADLGVTGFKLPVSETSVAHSPHFVVVDQGGVTRGIFDSEKAGELERLKALVTTVLKENPKKT